MTTRDEPIAEQKSPEEHEAFVSKTRRKVCDFFNFWTVCEEKHCRRAQACSIKTYPCFNKFWEYVPEDAKTWLRTVIKARCAGLSAQEANRAAEEEIARRRELDAALDAHEAWTKTSAVEQVGAARQATPKRLRVAPRLRVT